MKLLILSLLIAYALCDCPEVKTLNVKVLIFDADRGRKILKDVQCKNGACTLTHMLIVQQKQCVPYIVAKTHICAREIQIMKVVKCQTPALLKVLMAVQTIAINLATTRLKSSVPLHLTAKVVKGVQLVLQKILLVGAQQSVQFIVMRTK